MTQNDLMSELKATSFSGYKRSKKMRKRYKSKVKYLGKKVLLAA